MYSACSLLNSKGDSRGFEPAAKAWQQDAQHLPHVLQAMRAAMSHWL